MSSKVAKSLSFKAKAKRGYLDLYGPLLAEFGQTLPQFAPRRHVAQLLTGFLRAGPLLAEPVRVFFANGADARDVERVAGAAGIEFDQRAESHALRVARDVELRGAMARAGFDAFADFSALENTEQFQVVVFGASQARPMALALAEEEAGKISAALPGAAAPGPRPRAL